MVYASVFLPELAHTHTLHNNVRLQHQPTAASTASNLEEEIIHHGHAGGHIVVMVAQQEG